MERTYKIFEVLPSGSALKISVVSGLENARLTVRELANHTRNECYAEDAETSQVVAQMKCLAQTQVLSKIAVIAVFTLLLA
jgi:hypothetical protein